MAKKPPIGIVEKIVLPRFDRDMDYGADRRVLAMKRDKSVILSISFPFKTRGPSGGVEDGDYHKSAIYLSVRKSRTQVEVSHLIHHGNISNYRIWLHRNAIENAFNFEGLSAHIDLKKTIIVE